MSVRAITISIAAATLGHTTDVQAMQPFCDALAGRIRDVDSIVDVDVSINVDQGAIDSIYFSGDWDVVDIENVRGAVMSLRDALLTRADWLPA